MRCDIATRLLIVTEYGYSEEETEVSEEELIEFLAVYKKRFTKDNCDYIRQVSGWITTYHFTNGIVLLFRHGHYEKCLENKSHFFLFLKRMRSTYKYEYATAS